MKPIVPSSSESDTYKKIPCASTDDKDVDCHFCNKPFSADKQGQKWLGARSVLNGVMKCDHFRKPKTFCVIFVYNNFDVTFK